MFKVTSVSTFQTAEGRRISYTYSEIDDKTQEIVNSNMRRSIVLTGTETDVLDAIDAITNYAESNLNALMSDK